MTTTTTKLTAQQRIANWYQAWREGDWDGSMTPDAYVCDWDSTTDADAYEHASDPSKAPADMDHRMDDDRAEQFVAWLESQNAIAGVS